MSITLENNGSDLLYVLLHLEWPGTKTGTVISWSPIFVQPQMKEDGICYFYSNYR